MCSVVFFKLTSPIVVDLNYIRKNFDRFVC